jgi:hypothetical protein
VAPLTHVFGVSDKIINMAMADLLIGADDHRKSWRRAGADMIAIDTLVHNWMHRTGILRQLDCQHAYGARCYGARGCAAILREVAELIDARQFSRSYPKCFPRFVQHAAWLFCAQSGLGQCNGNRINDRARCHERDCPLYGDCARVALSPAKRTA